MIRELMYIFNKEQKRNIFIVLIIIIISSFFELLGVTAIIPFVQVLITPEELFQTLVLFSQKY